MLKHRSTTPSKLLKGFLWNFTGRLSIIFRCVWRNVVVVGWLQRKIIHQKFYILSPFEAWGIVSLLTVFLVKTTWFVSWRSHVFVWPLKMWMCNVMVLSLTLSSLLLLMFLFLCDKLSCSEPNVMKFWYVVTCC